MPFTAISKDQRINALEMSDKDWTSLKVSERLERTLKCPECDDVLIARAGTDKVCQHFAHNPSLIENTIDGRRSCQFKR